MTPHHRHRPHIIADIWKKIPKPFVMVFMVLISFKEKVLVVFVVTY